VPEAFVFGDWYDSYKVVVGISNVKILRHSLCAGVSFSTDIIITPL